MNNQKYLKVMFGNKGANYEYKIDEINVATVWNPNAEKGRDFGGFNYASEESILRWLHRGDTIYDVEIPNDAENIKLEGATTIYRTNKIIVKNPRKMTDEIAMDYYKKSSIPEKSYYKAMGAVAIMGYDKTAKQILRDKVNKENIDEVLGEWNDFINRDDRYNINATVKFIDEALMEIKSELLISVNVSKDPYIKDITNDKVINLTGESGSGKSYFSDKYIKDDNCIVIDADIVFNDKQSDNKESLEIRELFKDKSKDDLINDFDTCYEEILNYFKDRNKTIVIDSAQYRNIKNYSILKGKVIVMRTCIDTCYDRCISRFKNTKKNYTEGGLENFKNKKLGMYKWYKSLNEFLVNVNAIQQNL